MELKRFDINASANFSMHTIPSDRLSLKNVVQKEKMSKKSICWIITNLILGTAIYLSIYFSPWKINTILKKNLNQRNGAAEPVLTIIFYHMKRVQKSHTSLHITLKF